MLSETEFARKPCSARRLHYMRNIITAETGRILVDLHSNFIDVFIIVPNPRKILFLNWLQICGYKLILKIQKFNTK